MKSLTIMVMFDQKFRNRIAEFMARRKIIKICWTIGVFNSKGERVGTAMTIKADGLAYKLLTKMYKVRPQYECAVGSSIVIM